MIRIRSAWFLNLSLLLGMASCGSPGEQSTASPSSSVAQQFARGAEVFGASCAACHGDAGEGNGEAPRLVGPGAFPLNAPAGRKRKRAFRTAFDVAGFVLEAMPPSKKLRAQISEQDYWAVLAFALAANGVELTQPVDAALAKSLVLNK